MEHLIHNHYCACYYPPPTNSTSIFELSKASLDESLVHCYQYMWKLEPWNSIFRRTLQHWVSFISVTLCPVIWISEKLDCLEKPSFVVRPLRVDMFIQGWKTKDTLRIHLFKVSDKSNSTFWSIWAWKYLCEKGQPKRHTIPAYFLTLTHLASHCMKQACSWDCLI